MDDSFYIYKLTPFLLEKLWGGTKLRTMYGKGGDSSYLAMPDLHMYVAANMTV